MKGHEGEVGYFDPGDTPPARGQLTDAQWAKLSDRYHQRLQEYHRDADNMTKLQDAGRIQIDSGLVRGLSGGEWKTFAGDNDLFNITRNGQQVPTVEHNAIVNKMIDRDVGVMHGAHMFWTENVVKDIFERIVSNHMPSADGSPAAEPLVRFSPNTAPKLVDGKGDPWTPPRR